MEIVYDKLVRDNIPKIIKSNGGEPHFRNLNDEEYYKLATYSNTVYVFMSSKNTKEEQNKIIELKAKLRKQ